MLKEIRLLRAFLKKSILKNDHFSITLVYIRGRDQDQKSESGRKTVSSTVQLEYFLCKVSKKIIEEKANIFPSNSVKPTQLIHIFGLVKRYFQTPWNKAFVLTNPSPTLYNFISLKPTAQLCPLAPQSLCHLAWRIIMSNIMEHHFYPCRSPGKSHPFRPVIAHANDDR